MILVDQLLLLADALHERFLFAKELVDFLVRAFLRGLGAINFQRGVAFFFSEPDRLLVRVANKMMGDELGLYGSERFVIRFLRVLLSDRFGVARGLGMF